MDDFYNVHGRTPSEVELCDRAGLTPEAVQRLQTTPEIPLSIDDVTIISDGEKLTLLDSLVDTDPTPEENTFMKFDRSEWCFFIEEGLNPQQSEVISRRVGLHDDTPQTLDEIGKSFNVTRERIRQIEKKAFNKLREEMGV